MAPRARRAYNSDLRRQGAERTRQSIVRTAHELFLAKGYASTTLKEIAEAADVALPTVYAIFGTKRDLLLAVFNAARLGTVSEGLGHEHEPIEDMLPQPSAQLIAAEVTHTRRGGAPVARIIGKAAAADPHIADLWERTQAARYANMRRVVQAMRRQGTLAEEVSASEAADILWTLTSNELYELLVLDRGWMPARYEQWLAKMIDCALFS